VNDFWALSAESTDELNEALKSATFSDRIHVEVDELTRLLRDILSDEHPRVDKVCFHWVAGSSSRLEKRGIVERLDHGVDHIGGGMILALFQKLPHLA
jgi:hypothetical protein